MLLHGSGGDEHELVPVAGDLAPGSPVLAVRGSIPFDDGYAFFHRLPDRSIGETDIASRAAILADFIEGARTRYSLTRAPIAIGFSNGAIMAAALLDGSWQVPSYSGRCRHSGLLCRPDWMARRY